MMKALCIDLPLPPSSNTIYANIKGGKGGRRLRKHAEAWKIDALTQLAQHPDFVTGGEWDPNAPYLLALCFYFPTLENKGWHERWKRDSRPGAKEPHKKGDRKAKTRWKRIDLDNLLKLLGDTLNDSTGVDDSAIFERTEEKRVDADNPRVEIALFELPVTEKIVRLAA